MNFCSRCEATGLFAGMLAASMTSSSGAEKERRPGAGCRPRPERYDFAGWLAGLSLDRLIEGQLAVLDAVDAIVGQRRVAVLVDRVRAEHRLAVLGREQGLDDVG